MPDVRGAKAVHGANSAAPARRGWVVRLVRLAWRGCASRAVVPALVVVALVASIVWKPRPRLVWNASASAPVGLYAVTPPHEARTGDMVVAWTPAPARALAAGRRYLPSNIPLVKRIRASGGDTVCARGRAITINGAHAAVRHRRDARRRQMPWWTGCRRLAQGEYFLLMDGSRSFDGRYFGVTPGRDLVGRAALLWARPAKAPTDG